MTRQRGPEPSNLDPFPMPSSADRTLAIVCKSLPPYRVHVHRRLASEIPGLRLLTLNTHHDASRVWAAADTAAIGLVDLSEGDRGPRDWRREWRRGGRVIDELTRARADAVIVNGYNDAGRRRVIRWCRKNGVACFLWADSNLASDRAKRSWRTAAKRFLLPRVVRYCAGCIACGRLGRQYWTEYGADPNRVFVSPYEPDYGAIQAITTDEVEAVLRRHRLVPGRRRIVYSGRLVPVKRVDLILDGFIQIADERPEWDLVVIGDGELRSSLEDRVPSRLKDRVCWTGFLADQADVSAIYRGSDVLALASEYEPWAVVVNEAVAAGMAVVTTDVVGAAAELVQDGVNGRIVPAGDAERFRQALLDATSAESIDARKAASADLLAAWRERGDPVEGIREALRSVGWDV